MQNRKYSSVSILIIVGLSCVAAVLSFNSSQPDYIDLANTPYPDNTSLDIQERTFLMLKPDSVQRGFIGKIIQRLEQGGFKLIAIKIVWPSEDLIENHYISSIDRGHFPKLLEFMTSGPLIPMVWEGLNVIKVTRQMIGHSDPMESIPGTIRADYSICRLRSIIHGSETIEDADREINLWFRKNELVPWTSTYVQHLYDI